jgi:diaminohydroxyphosphoribosylaminopyrimidine deaminase/5-amino-6-(5-phosphoribosylamino)uracil reductase
LARRRGDAVGISAVDRVFLRRTYELAERGRGNTTPNPCVGAVVARDDRTLGEGFHRAHGSPHAEAEAFSGVRGAGRDPRGATLYLSLEPCSHEGLTAACTRAIADAGVARVVIGVHDPNPIAAGGAERLRHAGVAVDVANDPAAEAIVEDFKTTIVSPRPYVSLKITASLDGFVAAEPGSTWLSGERARDFVRDLRIAHDAVLVGARTVRIDDPQLTVRPPRARARPYRRIVACASKPVASEARIFQTVDGYERTIVLAPRECAEDFKPLETIAELLHVGSVDRMGLDVEGALVALKTRGIYSVLCEGGPTLAGALLERGLVDRLYWIVAPRLLANQDALPALAHARLARALPEFRFDRVEQLGDDVLISARLSATKKD